MADFIGPVVDWLVDVLENADLGELDDFAEVRKSWTGVVVNWPPCSVMARTTAFDDEGTARNQKHTLTVKFGVNGADPDEIAVNAQAYMKALDAAIDGAAWPADTATFAMRRVFIAAHDYGPLFALDGRLAKFPELHLEVEVYEL